MKNLGILFPHQLVEEIVLIERCTTIYLVEETLFFRQFTFHKQKIAFHRASMKFYAAFLQSKNIEVVYIDSFDALADVRTLIPHLKDISNLNTSIPPTIGWSEEYIVPVKPMI
jgi:deoxyribodipyrimidine photolyase-related protein